MSPALLNCLASRGRTGHRLIMAIDALLSATAIRDPGAYPDAPPGGSFWLWAT